MTAILFDSARPVQTERPFGILPARERRMPFTQADLDWVAQTFGALEDARNRDEFNRELEDLATETAWYDQFIGSDVPAVPEFGTCPVCRRSDYLEPDTGLCCSCDIAAAEMSSGMRPKVYAII